jgi:hypothetical protein
LKRLAILLTFVVCVPAQAATPKTRYAFVNGCYSVGDSGPLRFQAAALGEYLLLEADGTYRTAAGTVAEPGQDAIWTAHDDLTLTNGDATLSGAVAKATGCADIPEVELNATGTPSRGPHPYSGVKGFHDQHAHLMAFDFLGGNFHCGRPWSPFGVAAALPDCASIQGPQGSAAPVQNTLDFGQPAAPHDTVGWPTFKDWPGYDKLSYEGTYWRWLERAWMGGLRLIETNMVDNEVLCRLLPNHQTSCNDMDAVRRQTKYLFELQNYIDAQFGGPGKGFLRIVTNPFQARRVINRGKLAVVMGVEVSRIFGCGVKSGDPQCSAKDIDTGLDEIRALGIRSFFPIHKFDNAFGGTKMDGGPIGVLINAANKEETGAFWQVETCQTSQTDHDQIPAGGAADLLSASGMAAPGTFPVYPDPPHCNTKGLTALGEHVLRGMIERHFLIELDHMSGLAAQQSLSILEAEHYPGVLSSHSWANDANDLPRIYDLGGSVTPYAGDSGGFAKKWKADRVAYRSKRYPFGIGYGADTNGLGAQGPPRPDAAQRPVVYPFKSGDGAVTFERQVSGEQEYDINVDGVAHYGLYPDWIEDLRVIAGPKIVKDLFRGAETYLDTWERAYGIDGPTCPRGRLTSRGYGPVRIGMPWRRVLRRAGQPWSRPGAAFRWCRPAVARKRRVGAIFDRRGRVALVGARASRPVELHGHRVRGLHIDPVEGGRAVVVRGRSSAVVNASLASSRKRAIRAMRAAGL